MTSALVAWTPHCCAHNRRLRNVPSPGSRPDWWIHADKAPEPASALLEQLWIGVSEGGWRRRTPVKSCIRMSYSRLSTQEGGKHLRFRRMLDAGSAVDRGCAGLRIYKRRGPAPYAFWTAICQRDGECRSARTLCGLVTTHPTAAGAECTRPTSCNCADVTCPIVMITIRACTVAMLIAVAETFEANEARDAVVPVTICSSGTEQSASKMLLCCYSCACELQKLSTCERLGSRSIACCREEYARPR